MKKNILLLFMFIVFLSGCTTPHESKLMNEKEEIMDGIQEENYFDKDRWEVGIGCSYFQGICTEKFGTIHYADTSNKKIYIDYSMFGISNKYDIVYAYLNDYIFNEYIFDEERGNNLSDFFNKLREMNVDFYIDSVYQYDGREHGEYYNRTDNTSYVCRSDEDITYEEIDPYVENGESLEDIDFDSLLKSSDCKPQLLIRLKEENLEEIGTTIEDVEEMSKEYYDSEDFSLSFAYIESDNIVDSKDEFVATKYNDERGYMYRSLDSSVDIGSLDNWSSRYNF